MTAITSGEGSAVISSHGKRITPTGELRGALQPVRFGVLDAPVLTVKGESFLSAGDHVALQYWGNGVTRVTRVDSHASRPCLSHSIHVYEPDVIHDVPGE